jgi:hypothetical protein
MEKLNIKAQDINSYIEILNEDNIRIPEIVIDRDVDIDDMVSILKDMESDLSDEDEYRENVQEFIKQKLFIIHFFII